MTINKKQNGTEVTLAIEGRLDTITAPDLEKEVQTLYDSEKVVIDCAKLDYISSAGLRVFLSAHKVFSQKKGLVIKNVNDTLLDIFEVTGFRDILTIE